MEWGALRMVEDIENNEIGKIDKYYRLANYITVLQMYSNGNDLFCKEDIEHLKHTSKGHWGTSPGINFIYANINSFIKRNKIKTLIINGIGHSAVAVLSNLFIEGTISKYYDKYEYSLSGLSKFVKDFGALDGFRTENTAMMPSCIYDGGELGYSLATAYGAAMDNGNKLFVCIIGDGEFETGALASSWQLNKFVNVQNDGYVLPIIHLNGYKMGSESILSTMADEEITWYFKGLGYEAQIIEMEHCQMQEALEKSMLLFKNRKQEKAVMPVIVVKSLKGITCPIKREGKLLVGSSLIHKTIQITENEFKKWLNCYAPYELFDERFIIEDILDVLPPIKYRLGLFYEKASSDNSNYKCYDIKSSMNNIAGAKELLISYMNDNKNLKIFSPDELKSNKLGILIDVFGLRYSRIANSCIKVDGRIIELLNENICHAMMRGYLFTGRKGLLISYEAFSMIFSSMTVQLHKFYKTLQRCAWNEGMLSFTVLLTSVCWENTYSHQNPGFVHDLLAISDELIKIYYPIDSVLTARYLYKALQSKNTINCITCAKHTLPQYFSSEEADKILEKGYYIWENDKKYIATVIAIGDYMTREVLQANAMIKKVFGKIKLRIISLLDLSLLYSKKKDAEEIFTSSKAVFLAFNGYKATVDGLLFNLCRNQNVYTYGYCGQGDVTAPDLYKMILNRASRFDIAKDILLHCNKGEYICVIDKIKDKYINSLRG